ncbi:hypothetical protein F8154_12440 [Alkaliphilus pronyensis]|uniref:Selenocysteine lyase n=1 Tax=Alkaliphilus pronyensis TaxID=1482732 RepID=A0A6I0F8C3_9FIRM|nr:hypothetical protein [Alkaliphilus pronyensis]KAB3531875.1 hypothetical protein F8154_12440 [Alkaliphilus pronyensis]
MDFADVFLLVVFGVPVYGLLIWSYFEPEESYLLSRRWMFEEEPQLSQEAISFQKKSSLVAIIVLTLFIIITVLK